MTLPTARAAASALLAALALACGTRAQPPPWPEIAPLPAEHRSGVLLPGELPSALRVVLAWTEDGVSDPEIFLGDPRAIERHQRAALARFRDVFARPPVRELRVLRHRGAGVSPTSFDDLLATAGRRDHDLVVVLRTRSHASYAGNGWSPLFFLLPVAPVVPGYAASLRATAHACALRVHDGEALACSAARAERGDGAVTPLRRRARHRELRLSALEDSVGAVAEDLYASVRRAARSAPALPR